MNIIDWDHVEWAASVDKTRDIQPRDFEDYKRMACVAMSLRAQNTQLRADLAAERELADRLAGDAENLIKWFIANLGENKGELDDIQESLAAYRTRRKK